MLLIFSKCFSGKYVESQLFWISQLELVRIVKELWIKSIPSECENKENITFRGSHSDNQAAFKQKVFAVLKWLVITSPLDHDETARAATVSRPLAHSINGLFSEQDPNYAKPRRHNQRCKMIRACLKNVKTFDSKARAKTLRNFLIALMPSRGSYENLLFFIIKWLSTYDLSVWKQHRRCAIRFHSKSF